jgi:hypothetical protein
MSARPYLTIKCKTNAYQRLPTSNAAVTAQLAGTSSHIQSIHNTHPTHITRMSRADRG